MSLLTPTPPWSRVDPKKSTDQDPFGTHMDSERYRKAQWFFLMLSGLFIAALVVTNLIANRFVTVDMGFYTFTIPAGILPYPITFLVTDILSEIYGRQKTSQVIVAGFVASIFVLFVLWLAVQFPAIENSPVDDATFNQVFGNTWRIIAASMLAYLSAQMVDVRVYHFWKRLTNGRHLWLRNNASTIFSQLVDSTLVIAVVFWGQVSMGDMGSMVLDSWMFKAMVALLDTVLIYVAVYALRSQLRLKLGEEVRI